MQMGKSVKLFIITLTLVISATSLELTEDDTSSKLRDGGISSKVDGKSEVRFAPEASLPMRQMREKRVVGGDRVEFGAYPFLALTKGKFDLSLD